MQYDWKSLVFRIFEKPDIKIDDYYDQFFLVTEGGYLNQNMFAVYAPDSYPNELRFYRRDEFDKYSRAWVRIDLTKRFSRRRMKRIIGALSMMLNGDIKDLELDVL